MATFALSTIERERSWTAASGLKSFRMFDSRLPARPELAAELALGAEPPFDAARRSSIFLATRASISSSVRTRGAVSSASAGVAEKLAAATSAARRVSALGGGGCSAAATISVRACIVCVGASRWVGGWRGGTSLRSPTRRFTHGSAGERRETSQQKKKTVQKGEIASDRVELRKLLSCALCWS